jgi:hypothetical protein
VRRVIFYVSDTDTPFLDPIHSEAVRHLLKPVDVATLVSRSSERRARKLREPRQESPCGDLFLQRRIQP